MDFWFIIAKLREKYISLVNAINSASLVFMKLLEELYDSFYSFFRESPQEKNGEHMNDLLNLLNTLAETIEGLKTQLADAQAALDVASKQSYDNGFAAGVASVADKIYSQVEMDAAIEAAVAPLKLEIEAMKLEIEALKLQVEEQGKAAVAAFKAEMLAKYEEMQVVETEAETGFKEFLK